jgi:hypothetical protein
VVERSKVGIVAEHSLFGFFHGHVVAAARAQRRPVTDEATLYLAHLLVEQTRRPDDLPDAATVTLAELRAQAVAAPASVAMSRWRRLGDTALFLAGFLREEIARRRVTPAYAETLGASAYGTLGLLSGRGEGSAQPFAELTARFSTCVAILTDVRDDVGAPADTDLLRLYEEWLRTGSPRAASRLQARGVVPLRALPS